MSPPGEGGREGKAQNFGTRSRKEVKNGSSVRSRSTFQNDREKNRLKGLSRASEKKQGLSVPVEQNSFY